MRIDNLLNYVLYTCKYILMRSGGTRARFQLVRLGLGASNSKHIPHNVHSSVSVDEQNTLFSYLRVLQLLKYAQKFDVSLI